MKRWWDSPTEAVEVLKSVDGSDSVQGVGTAILGYHALSQAVLKPLSQRTLVDVETALNAVDSIDLTLVSKAVAEAVRPTLDEAADRYGELFAEDLHWRAKESLERIVLMWTNTGMPWPHAIERASEVYGVPLERLGRYATVMKTQSSPIVRQDAADRVLMTYASERGKLESDFVSKSLDGAEAFEFEREHPRDESGRFATKNVDPLNRAKRRERRMRRNGRVARDSRKIASNKKASISQAREQAEQLLSLFETSADRIKSVASKLQAKPSVKPSAGKLVAAKLVGKPIEEQQKLKIDLKAKYKDLHMHHEDAYFVGTIDDLKKFRETGKLPLQTVYSDDEVKNMIDRTLGNPQGMRSLANMVLFRIKDTPIVDGGPDTPDGGTLPKEAIVVSQNNVSWKKNIKDLTNNTWYNPEVGFSAPVYDVYVSNSDDFISKELSGSELFEFNQEHPRDEDGRFSGKGPNYSQRKTRRMRRNERLRRNMLARGRLVSTKNNANELQALLQQDSPKVVAPKFKMSKLQLKQQRKLAAAKQSFKAKATDETSLESSFEKQKADDVANMRVHLVDLGDDIILGQDFMDGRGVIREGGYVKPPRGRVSTLRKIAEDLMRRATFIGEVSEISSSVFNSPEYAVSNARAEFRAAKPHLVKSVVFVPYPVLDDNGKETGDWYCNVLDPTTVFEDVPDALIFDNPKDEADWFENKDVKWDIRLVAEDTKELFMNYGADPYLADLHTDAAIPFRFIKITRLENL